uniref:FAS1 domain-containing protein n=1 Tax=Oryza brachyantha TaxID=4533 RepID=J3MU73_ORYBR
MEFKAAVFASAVVAILLCCPAPPAFAQKHKSLPPSPAPAPAPHHVDLADLLSVAGPFHTFLDYLEKTDVLRTFQSQANSSKEGITVFVPKDSAFASLRKTTFANLTSDQLKSLVQYHALPRYYSLAEFNKLSTLNPVPTFAGGEYTLNLTDDMGTVHVRSMWSNPKRAPAPAPAPDAKPADAAASPLPGKSSSAKAKADKKTSSSHRAGVGIAGYLLLAASASAGLLLLW